MSRKVFPLPPEVTGTYTFIEYVRFRSPSIHLALIAIVFVCPLLRAQTGLGGALFEPQRSQILLHGTWGARLVAADFDRDQRPDGAVLLNAGELRGRPLFRIRLHVTAGEDRELTFASNETAIALATQDVNRDGVPDLVVEQVFTRKRLQIWLNDGHGEFRPARVDDFPQSADARCGWSSPLRTEAYFIVALPSRTGNDHLVRTLKVFRSGSSSSHWFLGRPPERIQSSSLAFASPRSPPTFFLSADGAHQTCPFQLVC